MIQFKIYNLDNINQVLPVFSLLYNTSNVQILFNYIVKISSTQLNYAFLIGDLLGLDCKADSDGC